RKQVQFAIFRSPVVDRDADQNIFRSSFGILDKNIEVAIVIEDASVDQFVFMIFSSPFFVCGDDVIVGISRMWILVEVLHVGVSRRAVQIEVIFLHILPVVAFAIREAEEALFQNWI